MLVLWVTSAHIGGGLSQYEVWDLMLKSVKHKLCL